MSFLKLVYEKQKIPVGVTPKDYFERLDGEHSQLFDSCGSGGYSYIAYDPFLSVWSMKGVAQMRKKKDFFHFKKSAVGQIIDTSSGDALLDLFNMFELKDDAPVPFPGGAAGFLSYDYGCRFVGVEQEVYDDLHLPDYQFNFYDKVIVFDHDEDLIYLLAVAETDMSAQRKVEEIKVDLRSDMGFRRAGEIGEIESNINETDYIDKVLQIKELLKQGQTYQVNFSQRFKADCSLDGWSVYKKLSALNPSSFSCYQNFPDYQIISSSPELLIRKRGDVLETWPIKGTVKRGKNEQEDQKLAEELIKSKKDNAELSMIVDLERNDLGKVCEVGTVKVDSHREIHKYSHVIHTVSRVSGILDNKKNIFDALKAIFPSGSITGCPKKRTMEIIDRFEDYKRGVYTGAAGFIGFNGSADFNILIRTMLLKDREIFFNAGGGIVIDSDPKKEYDESVMKAQALIDTLKK